MKDKLETLLLLLGAVCLLGTFFAFFIGGLHYFILGWLLFLSSYGLFYKKTLSILFVFSKGWFAQVWGVIYFIFLLLFCYVLFLASQYEEPKTLMQYFFGTDVENDLKQLLEYLKTFIIGMFLLALVEVGFEQLKVKKKENKYE